MALRDWPLWSAATTGCDALRDGSMCDTQLVPWESCATTECTYPVVAADHSGQSRSAIAGTSDY